MSIEIAKGLVALSKPAKRLEHVRQKVGFETVKDFWKEISKTYDVSYEAVRNYHSDREPPARYYAAVAKRFVESRERRSRIVTDRVPRDAGLQILGRDAGRLSQHTGEDRGRSADITQSRVDLGTDVSDVAPVLTTDQLRRVLEGDDKPSIS